MLKRKFLLKLVNNSTIIRERLSFKQHIVLYKTISELNDNNINKLFSKIHEDTTYPKTNPKTQKILTQGLTVASLAVPIPGLAAAVIYLSDLNTYKCRMHCEKNHESDRNLCYKNCKYEAIKWASKYIEQQIPGCSKIKKPKKCRKKLYKLLLTWRKKEVEASIKLGTQRRVSGLKGK
jgi:hypothetical protein